MKTVVLGLFDDPRRAEQVLRQLAHAPLDLRSVMVLHADRAVQHELEQAGGLPRRRSPFSGAVTGAVLGAVVGLLAQSTLLPLVSLGWLLAASAGLLLGALGGAAVSIGTSRLPLPPSDADQLAQALEEGAAAILVQTDKLPTARAIADLFQLSGSRVAPATEGLAGAESDDLRLGPGAPSLQEDHSLFAPRHEPGARSAPGDARNNVPPEA